MISSVGLYVDFLCVACCTAQVFVVVCLELVQQVYRVPGKSRRVPTKSTCLDSLLQKRNLL